MSVYKPTRTRFWHYDFVVKGQRFHGSTGCESKRAAQAEERRLRNERAVKGSAAIQQTVETPPPDMTLDVGIERWWTEKGERLGSAADRERQLHLWIDLLGKHTRWGTVREAHIAGAIKKRRLIHYRGKLPSEATINRFVAALRAVWRYLDNEDFPLPRINWGKFTTEEVPEHPPEISAKQLDKLDAAARARANPQRAKRKTRKPADWVQLMAELYYTYGMRAGELYFAPAQFDPEEHNINIPKMSRKYPNGLDVPLLPHHTRALAARWSRAKEAGLPHLWYDEVDGKLVPIKRGRGDYQLRAALKAAGLGTNIHRLRHRAATELLRSSNGNLKLVKESLGHASIQSTQRYANVSKEDRRKALAAISRNSPEAEEGGTKKADKG